MAKFSKKAILSAKDSVKNASDKLTKIALDMETTETAPSPEQVKEIVESIADVAQEIVQQAEMVAEGLEEVTGDVVENEEVVEGTEDKGGVNPQDREKLNKMEARVEEQDEELDDLKKFKEASEKETLAHKFANLFPSNQQSAKFDEFMKMDKSNAELSTVLGATENVLKSVVKTASMRKSNETIIFKESTQKNASMSDYSNRAKSLVEI